MAQQIFLHKYGLSGIDFANKRVVGAWQSEVNDELLGGWNYNCLDHIARQGNVNAYYKVGGYIRC
ncbi:hypothetical protein D3C75_969660 [compost metagenome]